MSKHVISTLTRPNRYAKWVTQAGVGTMLRSVLIQGGAGVIDKKLITPEGVRTEVSEADAEFLASHGLFKEHQARGFVKIINIAKDPNAVAQSMPRDDGSRPRNEGDVAAFVKDKGLGRDDPATEVQAVTNRK